MKPRRDAVEMVDGRLYWSDDNWQTVWKRRAGHWADGFAKTPSRKVTGREADLARFLAITQSSAARLSGFR